MDERTRGRPSVSQLMRHKRSWDDVTPFPTASPKAEKAAHTSQSVGGAGTQTHGAPNHLSRLYNHPEHKAIASEPAHGHAETTEMRIKRHWYPYVYRAQFPSSSCTDFDRILLFVIALNMCLVASAFYIIYNADVSLRR